ncbi:Hypothetical protein SCF082_LOCUS25041 [Durusdinium trenchii]|uniref:Uncharacterized protein n=1 Tax=Durusdinium trenchii TaxID=1381693 RepID=A0ABP0LZK4_9DINO
MRHYVGGKWGFSLIFGIYGSVFPYAFIMAVVNAALTFGVSVSMELSDGFNADPQTTETVATLMAIFSAVMMFILTFRSDIAYERWWEGGTLLQKTRGEWFNAYSSLVAFSPLASHRGLSARMSNVYRSEVLLDQSCKDRYLESTRDKELSRGIVNLQNARKIADFPFPYPYAQVSILMLLLHWGLMPFWCSMLLSKTMAAATSFVVLWMQWCLNFIALQLEAPFGDEPNDLPMDQMILDWNNSLCTLLSPRSQRPPAFEFDPAVHGRWITSLSSDIPTLLGLEDRQIQDFHQILYTLHKSASEQSFASERRRRKRRPTLHYCGSRDCVILFVALAPQCWAKASQELEEEALILSVLRLLKTFVYSFVRLPD